MCQGGQRARQQDLLLEMIGPHYVGLRKAMRVFAACHPFTIHRPKVYLMPERMPVLILIPPSFSRASLVVSFLYTTNFTIHTRDVHPHSQPVFPPSHPVTLRTSLCTSGNTS